MFRAYKQILYPGCRKRPVRASVFDIGTIGWISNANLDARTDGERVLLDRVERRPRVASTFQARHGALGRSHPQSDLFLRHTGAGARRGEIGDQHLKSLTLEHRGPTATTLAGALLIARTLASSSALRDMGVPFESSSLGG